MTAENDAQRIARLTPIEEVLSRIDALVKPIGPCERDPAAAAGLALAQDILAERRPAAALALRDGWAVRSELTADAGSYAPAPLPGASWVDAGAPLPSGADAVAPPDAVSVRDGRAEALAPIAPGEGVLPAGTTVWLRAA